MLSKQWLLYQLHNTHLSYRSRDIPVRNGIQDCNNCSYEGHKVVLAQEVGAATKAVDICHRHSLPCIPFCSVQGDGITETQYLQLPDIILAENVIWVDTTDGLADAARHFSEVKVVGIDCEWKPNYLKQETNKASILQIATGKRVFIFDLIKLFEEKRDALDDCLKLIFHSSNILKLGYSLHNDLEKLFRSYKDLMCFQLCESTLDLQTLSPSSKGGLSGLTKIILGRHLNKASQMTDWEQRPLSHIQLHYAALDAAVLLSIFDILSHEPLTLGGVEGQEISDWKSHVKCFRTKISPKKRSAVLEPKAHFVGSSTGKELDDDLNSSRTMHDQEDSPPGFYQESEVMVVSGPDSKAPLSCSSDMACALEEDLHIVLLIGQEHDLGLCKLRTIGAAKTRAFKK